MHWITITALFNLLFLAMSGGYSSAASMPSNGLNRQTPETSYPPAREYHTAVWTGSEVLIWGGYPFSEGSNGERYNPASRTWQPIAAENAPSARFGHTAIWTGSEMIIWGGWNNGIIYNNGARYNPSTGAWTPMSTTGAPTRRQNHTAVWTGSKMIVWGGYDMARGYVGNGGIYDPATDQWTPITNIDAPAARAYHTAVWTGSEMIVWGGYGGTSYSLNDGGSYNPTTNRWKPVSNSGAPSIRYWHTAVWTGEEMIIWGGMFSGDYPRGLPQDSARYNPVTDHWSPVAASPLSARRFHSVVWTGREMIVWGGMNENDIYVGDGAIYYPAFNAWRSISVDYAPVPRYDHKAVWTNGEMVVWGGSYYSMNDPADIGGRFNPLINAWTDLWNPYLYEANLVYLPLVEQ